MLPTIVLVHGAWMSPISWEKVETYYESRGYTVEVPAWPTAERSVAELRASPDPALGKVGVREIVDHYAEVVSAIQPPPVLIGHSFGGLFVQMLLDRGLGAAGVAIDPAPPKGVMPGAKALHSSLPTLFARPGMLTLSFADFQWGWVSELTEDEQHALYEAYVVPTPRKVFVQLAGAPFSKVTKVNYNNEERAPLLIISGGKDRTVTAGMNKANFVKYRRNTKAVTEYKNLPDRTHSLVMDHGWKEVADLALDWVEVQLGLSSEVEAVPVEAVEAVPVEAVPVEAELPLP